MDDLKKVKVTMSYSKQSVYGSFHLWHDKKFEDGTNMLYAIVEDVDGNINKYDLESCKIQFISENEYLKFKTDNYINKKINK